MVGYSAHHINKLYGDAGGAAVSGITRASGFELICDASAAPPVRSLRAPATAPPRKRSFQSILLSLSLPTRNPTEHLVAGGHLRTGAGTGCEGHFC
jgi:hypothetical protein